MDYSEILDIKEDLNYKNLTSWLTPEVISLISESNDDPSWMREMRLDALEKFLKKPLPGWWPDLSWLNLDNIHYFAKAEDIWKNATSWDDVPENIKNTFDRLGIPEAEKKMLAWVWAQFDSEVVYHSLKKELVEAGIIFKDMSVACKEHPDLLRKYFMKAIPVTDHKFSMLHAAVWSWGTFLYIPKWVKVSEPLQAYFRMNVRAGWQFEHTIIVLEDEAEAHYIEWCSAPKYWTSALHAGCVEIYVGKKARLRYSSVENWSIDTYNLNTKRAIVEENWHIAWVGGNMWAWVTMLYPCSVLVGNWSSASHIWIAFANEWQIIDAGAKVIHIWENTSSKVVAKSLSKAGWVSTYRWFLDIRKSAHNSVASIECDWLILDSRSVSDAIPYIKLENTSSIVAHEASAGKINEEYLFYLESRWIDRKEAENMIVNWFVSPVIKELPMEYAAEMNVLINMEMEK
ncbi:MAG: FeS assembly protein SufB [uncultured bacterium (gcode 4)]|uniref:FeS assembly protein SufB n=1 Tax=uncultured bacterium (gcode 4) TaxID=1234023 RepID=K2H294_9BACT|nr:MAG: FeS assembly protein SufB [uncultured bacterium (gcode 4)]